MRVSDTAHPDVKVIEPAVFGDDRGFFYEPWNARAFAAAGLEVEFVQDNHSRSAQGVLRGLHYQLRRPQGKLVRAVAGTAFDVVVDLRRSSSRFGQWVGVELGAGSKHAIWVPPGFAHGFLALEEGTEIVYKCTQFYDPGDEHSLLWSDPELGIAWPLKRAGPLILSSKDAAAHPLAEAETYA